MSSKKTPQRKMHPRSENLLVSSILIVFFLFFSGAALSDALNFDFPAISLRNFTLIGDSYLRNGVVGLTKELGVPSSSAGTVILNDPVAFFDPEANLTASFSTRFGFSIGNVNPSSFGDGLTFFLSPDNRTLGSSGGYLGLVNSTRLTKNRFVAVEFDTKSDSHFSDPDDNHVGLDIESLVSIKTANPVSYGITLKSGNLITAWIEYRHEKKELEVFLSYSSFKPQDPILKVQIDLSDYLKEFMFLGFSASTEGSTEVHSIENWSFSTYGINPDHPHNVHPHNVSDASVGPSSSIPGSGDGHNRKLGLGLGIGIPGFFCVVLVVFGLITLRKWRGSRIDRSLKAELLTGPRQFSYQELKVATKGFDSSRVLGSGAFGTVYKAVFTSSGALFAVKRSKHSHEGKSEFLGELSIIACLRHKNLVQLQGWCVEKGELLLVYEFMANGSLDQLLYEDNENGKNLLKWPHRYNIAVGLASALTYLHQECEQQVIHRDIKASNIMLDSCYNARLGDFGLARLMDHDKSPISTLTAGTMGYLAPEYLQYGKATDKTDVFSYGVVILELACGRRPIDRDGSGKMVNLVDWVWKLYSEGKITEGADKRLNGEFQAEEMNKLLLIGLSCANPDSTERPTMRRVFQILSNEAEPIPVPKIKPSLTFCNSMPLSLDDIISEQQDDDESTDSQFEIVVT